MQVHLLNLAELQREAKVHLSDLDLALALMTKMGDLFERLDAKQKVTLLQISVKKLIVNTKGEIIDHELNSPFVYLGSLAGELVTPDVEDGGRATEKLLSELRFEGRGKLEELSV